MGKGLHNVGGLLQLPPSDGLEPFHVGGFLQRPPSKARGVRSKLDLSGNRQLSGVPLGKPKDMPHVGGLL